ncbi:MAG TPA: TolC family outer membrane protein [Hypericibacter adhaerens]|nr:TolC family outer membrane protein [Hypericibacter adhaerens]HWA46254.1 TolC family outer membrane protein [Hypericibacter adhaerens]
MIDGGWCAGFNRQAPDHMTRCGGLNPMKQRKILLLAAVAASALFAMSDNARAITLEEAAALAVSTNPRVGVVSNDRKAVDQELRQGEALYYPQVDVRLDGGPEWANNNTTNNNGYEEGRLQPRSDQSLTISQLIFDGHFADSEVARQQSRVKSAANRVSETSEDVSLDAVRAYIDVLRNRERLAISEDNVAVHRSTLSDVQLRAQSGGGNIADVRQAEARLASSEAALTQIRGDLADAEYAFMKTVGQTPDSLTVPTVPTDMLPQSLEDAVAQSIANSPTVGFSRADVEVAAHDVEQQQASYWPDVRLELSANNNINAGGTSRSDQDASALVVARWNLYRGGADTARIHEFKHRLTEATDQLLVNERQVAEDAKVAWNAIQTARSNVEILQRSVEASRNTRDIYRQQFDIGQRGLLDLLDADNELFLNRDALVTATYAEMTASYRLLATMGVLTKALNVTKPETSVVPTFD